MLGQTSVNDLVKQRAAALDAFAALANQETLSADEQRLYREKKQAVLDFDGRIERAREAQALAAASAQPVADQLSWQQRDRVPARPKTDRYEKEPSLVVGAMIRMIGAGGGSISDARAAATGWYGEHHPVTRALMVSVGASGGFIVPPDYVNEIIELLRPMTVVRDAGPRVIPMPRGTMTLPGQASPASATYGSETQQITSSQQGLNQIVASAKKLTALVAITNDMMRFADPAADAFVRDDLVKVIGLRQDLAFLVGDGTQDTPRGYLSFANGWVQQNGGTAGNWSSTANSTAAVNGTPGSPLLGMNGGNFITSTETFTLNTVVTELGGMVQKLDGANVPDSRRVWFMNPRSKNYLLNVQNTVGQYVFRDEMAAGRLYGYPFRPTTQMPINIWDTTGTNKDCSFVMLAEMEETMILDSMSLELAVSREAMSTAARAPRSRRFRTITRWLERLPSTISNCAISAP
jgi:HK97 family phage major capsid protein